MRPQTSETVAADDRLVRSLQKQFPLSYLSFVGLMKLAAAELEL